MIGDETLIIMDEQTHPKLTDLNKMCDNTYSFGIKGAAPIRLEKYTLIWFANAIPDYGMNG